MSKYGYHILNIEKGIPGKASKIVEEAFEFLDAENQQCKLMCLIELSDLLGALRLFFQNKKHSFSSLQPLSYPICFSENIIYTAKLLHEEISDIDLLVVSQKLIDYISGYVKHNFNNSITYNDLITMSNITMRSFENGYRS